MIPVTERLPEFGERVIWRGVLQWRSADNQVSYFDDELTNEETDLEYGQDAYLLKDNYDYLVSMHPNVNELCDEFVTHWMPIPKI